MGRMKTAYHHGQLRESLISAAVDILQEQGLEQVSMRRLAERVGVSRTAAYHYFPDKTALLCALAADGFNRLQQLSLDIFSSDRPCKQAAFIEYVHRYVDFAVHNDQLYELMFGQTIWQSQKQTEELKDIAHGAFKSYVLHVESLQKNGVLPCHAPALRFSQVSWSTLHGLSRLVIDGIYADTGALQEMCEYAAHTLLGTVYNSNQ